MNRNKNKVLHISFKGGITASKFFGGGIHSNWVSIPLTHQFSKF